MPSYFLMKDLLHFEYLGILVLSILAWSVSPVCALNIYDFCEKGFWYQKSVEIQMDTTPEKENILLYGRDVGHYPEFDLFEYYYVICREDVLWKSSKFRSNEMEIRTDDRNADGVFELNIRYFKDSKFQTDQRGWNLQADWNQDVVEWKDDRFSTTTSSFKNQNESSISNAEIPRLLPSPEKRKDLIKTLIINGQDGSHTWQYSTKVLKTLFEKSGFFAVDVATTPNWNGNMEKFHPNFSNYNLVLLNYGGETWSKQTRTDFEKYVANGGGVVVIHSAVIPMEGWKEYNQITGLGAWNQRNEKDGPYVYWENNSYVYDYSPGWAGHHDRQHKTLVEHRAIEHPVLKGLPIVWRHFKDEIYTRLRGPAQNIEILATIREHDRDEPIMWTTQWGKGRVFVDLLGHCGNDPDLTYSMDCVGFQTTLLRGAEWAATGRVSQDVPDNFPTQDKESLQIVCDLPDAESYIPPSKKKYVVLAYVTSWSNIIPDPECVTHINYAFGYVKSTFDGVRIDNEQRLRMLVGLKDKNPDLKVMLSIGGWGSGNFSEMAASDANRKAFANDCQRVIEEFHLDGIDIDWEFPTSNSAGISSSPNDTANYTLMMKEIRNAIGTNNLLTLASQAGAGFIDFASVEPIVDFVNVMTYDMGNPPKHHAPLYRSKNVGWISCEEGIDKHIAAGIPVHKLTLGIPFYGHGTDGIPGYIDYKNILKLEKNYIQEWDEDACVPYLANNDGKLICTYETPRSIAIKCEYLKKKGMLGAMYWDYNADDTFGTLRNSVYQSVINPKSPLEMESSNDRH